MCQVHTGAYVSLLASRKIDYTACHPRKSITYILHVVPIITTHTHDRRKSIGKRKQRKEKKIKERKEKRRKRKRKRKRKKKKRKDKKSKKSKKSMKRQDKKRKQGKEKRKKKLILADLRN